MFVPLVVGPSPHEVAQIDDEAVFDVRHITPVGRILVLGHLQSRAVALQNGDGAVVRVSAGSQLLWKQRSRCDRIYSGVVEGPQGRCMVGLRRIIEMKR